MGDFVEKLSIREFGWLFIAGAPIVSIFTLEVVKFGFGMRMLAEDPHPLSAQELVDSGWVSSALFCFGISYSRGRGAITVFHVPKQVVDAFLPFAVDELFNFLSPFFLFGLVVFFDVAHDFIYGSVKLGLCDIVSRDGIGKLASNFPREKFVHASSDGINVLVGDLLPKNLNGV